MKKKMIAVLCSAALAAPVIAQAEGLEIYGKARMALSYADNANPDGAYEDSALVVNNYNSRIGFKGSEDLGNGMKAIYQYERQVDLDKKNDADTIRDSFVGLKGDFGSLKIGRISLPYKKATSGFDTFNDTEADGNGGDDGIIRHNTRADNTIAFFSNDISGAKFALSYSTSTGHKDELSETHVDYEDSAISGMVSYTTGPLLVSAAYETLKSGDDKAAKVHARYTMEKDKVGVVIDRVSGQEPTLYVSYDRKMSGNYSLHAAVAARAEKDDNENGMSYFVVGATHAYSKSTEVYALFTQVNNDDQSRVSLKKADAVTGETISALSLGINIKFSTK